MALGGGFPYHYTMASCVRTRASALFKQDTGGLVVRWVTTSESPLLYVFIFLLKLENEGRIGVVAQRRPHVFFGHRSSADGVLLKERACAY
jgi:hypothetical protein